MFPTSLHQNVHNSIVKTVNMGLFGIETCDVMQVNLFTVAKSGEA